MSLILDTESAARAIAARRAFIRKSGMKIENETQTVIYQKLISDIETGKKSLESLRLDQILALIKVLEWTPQEFTEATGVELPTIQKTIDVSRSSRTIPTFSLTISLGKGEIVKTEQETVIPEDWPGTFKALVLAPNGLYQRILVYQEEKPSGGQGIGSKLITKGSDTGYRAGRVLRVIEDTYFLEAIDNFEPESFVVKHSEIVGIVYRDAEELIQH